VVAGPGRLGVGLGGLIEPRALGVGYDVIRDLLTGHLVVQAVVVLLLVKAAIWLVALSSGTSGGVLAPLLILGGAMGWLVGQILPGDAGFWALLGMAAMLGGTMRSPLTAVIFAVELTGDWRMLAPLLAASAAAYATTVLLLKRSILTEKIARRGRHITREYGVDPYELVRASEVMIRLVDTLPAQLSIPEAVAVLQQGRHQVYPVVEASGRLVGMVSRADALAWRVESGLPDQALAEQTLAERVSDAALPVAHPDDVVARVVNLMLASGQGRIPVTDPASGVLVGLLTRKDLLQIHATTSRAEDERQAYFKPGGR
jgi:CIC family chloride channel protein